MKKQQKIKTPEALLPEGVVVRDDWRAFLHERWNEIRTDVEDFDLVQFGRDNISDVLYQVPQLQPLLERLTSVECDPTDNGRVTQGVQDQAGWQYIELPRNYTLYKGMDSYVTPDEEKRYFREKTEPLPYWLGDQMLATRYAALQNGGLHAYRAKQPLKLLVWNDNNIERLYSMLCCCDRERAGGPEKLYSHLRQMFHIGFGIGIEPYKRLKYVYPQYDYIPISPVVQRGGFYCKLSDSGLSYYYKKFYLHKLLFRWWILPVVEQLGLHGVYGPQHYNPLVTGGIWFQEFIISDYARYMRRATEDPLDWCNYVSLLDFRMPDDGFIITGGGAAKNHNHRMMKWYLEQLEGESLVVPVEKPDGPVVVSINVHNFRPIKENGNTVEAAILGMLRMAEQQHASLVVMCEVSFEHIPIIKSHMHQYGYFSLSRLPSNTTTIVMSRVACSMEPPVQISDGEHPEIRVARWTTPVVVDGLRICATHLSIGINPYLAINQPREPEIRRINSSYRMAELDRIAALKPDVIIGDLNFIPSDPEFHHLKKLGYRTGLVDSTTPFGTQVDYAWYRRGGARIHTLPYHWSDHKPIVLTLTGLHDRITAATRG